MRNLDGLQELFSTTDKELLLKMNKMRFKRDNNKTLIHYCCQVKSYLILEEILEKFKNITSEDLAS
jgi:hypothetical protein